MSEQPHIEPAPISQTWLIQFTHERYHVVTRWQIPGLSLGGWECTCGGGVFCKHITAAMDTGKPAPTAGRSGEGGE